MDGGAIFFIFIVIVIVAVVFLKGFDSVAGRGPKQVSDGINRSNIGQERTKTEPDRMPCPECAEMIMPMARKCPFCKSEVYKKEEIRTTEPPKILNSPPKYVPCPKCDNQLSVADIYKGLRECPKCKNSFAVE